MNWSGGKDSAMALYNILNNKNYKVEGLLTSVNAANQRISMHGVSGEMLVKQAESIGLPLTKINLPKASDMTAYENIMEQTLSSFTEQGIETSVFGDIFLEDLRKYREQQLEKLGGKQFSLFGKKIPEIWSMNSQNWASVPESAVLINSIWIPIFLGCDLDEYLIDKLPENVDPCGENGEFHTFVYAGPVFQNNLSIKNGERVEKSYNHDGKAYGYEFCDILLEDHQQVYCQ